MKTKKQGGLWDKICIITDSEKTTFDAREQKEGYVAHPFFEGADSNYYHATVRVVKIDGRQVWEYLGFERIP